MRLPKSLRRKSKAEMALYLFVAFIFFLVAASYVFIFLWAILSGAKTHTEVVMEPFGLPEIWHWEHFLDVFNMLEVNGSTFWDMLFNSVFFSVVGTFISLFTTMNFAYCCTKYKFFGSTWPYVIIVVMMTLPIYGAGGAEYRLYYNLGFIDSYTSILTSIGGFSALFLYFRAFFQNLSWSYAEAAMMDGAGHFSIYFRVMAPMAKPIFGALYLSSWLEGWNNYQAGLIFRPNLPTLPVGIYQFNLEMVHRARLDILFAACVLIALPAIILFIVFNKVITTNVSIGGLKG